MITDKFIAVDETGRSYIAETKEADGVITATWKKDDVAPAEYLDVHAPFFEKDAGDDGCFVLGSVGRYGALTYFTVRDDVDYVSNEVVLPICGVTEKTGSILAVPDGMVYDMAMAESVKNGHYSLFYRVRLEGDAPYEDVSIRFYRLPAGSDYSDMAVFYRKLLLSCGDIRLIRDREGERPALRYAADAPEIRIRMGWKPAPSPVLMQTEETEPPMHVACTFDEVCRLIDALKARGVKKAELCLVGWNKSGHDGRWPTAFPVEPALGGEERLRALIAYAKDNGYAIVCHTNSTDAYAISPYFTDDVILKDKNGNTMSAGNWSGGSGRRVCPAAAERIAEELLPKVRELGFEGLHYIDVLAVIMPMKCAHPAHPVTRRETVAHYERIMALCHELFGGFASEGAYDFARRYVDYGFYVTGGMPDVPILDVHVPLWQIVYHGIILAGASTKTVNANIREKKEQLYFEECGGRLSFYVHQKFMTGQSANWLGADDLLLGEHLEDTADRIAEGIRQFEKTTALSRETVRRHEILSDTLRCVTYDNGTKVYVNYGDEDAVLPDVTVPAKSTVYQ